MSLPELSISFPYGIPSTSRPLPNMITTRNNVIESPISRAGGGNDGHDDDDDVDVAGRVFCNLCFIY